MYSQVKLMVVFAALFVAIVQPAHLNTKDSLVSVKVLNSFGKVGTTTKLMDDDLSRPGDIVIGHDIDVVGDGLLIGFELSGEGGEDIECYSLPFEFGVCVQELTSMNVTNLATGEAYVNLIDISDDKTGGEIKYCALANESYAMLVVINGIPCSDKN
ncbi:hypothetical protein HHI36_021643 [Cryptolaemus montrouzieri]|uniref:Uncharacterized protein n=1 Tax=Cryptolaemus montrouzieri TaxID=559131 RepID=A0ABD2MY58_9CUCU